MNKTMPLVSVVVPAYNAEEFIFNSLGSVLSQNYRPIELIIVNDGSSDRTGDLVEDFIDKNNLVSVEKPKFDGGIYLNSISVKNESCDFSLIYVEQTNGGPSRARNAGINISTGKYIAFLDADDQWTTKKLERQLNFLENNNLDVVFSDLSIEKQHSDSIPSVVDKYNWVLPSLNNEEGFWFKKLLEWNFIITSTLVVRASCFDNLDLFEESIRHGEDYDLCLRLALFFKFGFYPEVTCLRKIHNSNLSLDESKFYQNKMFILKKLIKQFPEELSALNIDLNRNILATLKGFSYFHYLNKHFIIAFRRLIVYLFYRVSRHVGINP